MIYECVDTEQLTADFRHADYRSIKADTPNQAKYIYSQLSHCDYINVRCRTKKSFPQWNVF